MKAVAVGLLFAALGACAVGPDYRPPRFATPVTYAEAPPTGSTAADSVPAEVAALPDWWQLFGDPTLDGLIARGLSDNPTLSIAASRIRVARLQGVVAAGGGLPAVTATGSATALRTGGTELPASLNLYAAGFDATWEVDLFGARRRAVEAAGATTAASLWDQRDGAVSVSAEIASDYVALRATQARIRLGVEGLRYERELLAMVEGRRRTGFVTALDVNQQSTLVTTAAAQIPLLEAQERVYRHALCILVNEPPEGLIAELVPRSGAPLALPPPMPPGLPSELLQRRPDIRAAERRRAAGNAAVGVRTAALYPSLDLIGIASFAGSAVSGLFSRENLVKAALGLVTEPVLDGGRSRAALGEAKEQFTQADLAYRITVLGALREVEDSLARQRAEDARHVLLLAALQSGESTAAIAEAQYRTGFVTYINVLAAEFLVLGARDELVQSEAAQATSLISLYKSLGGGWTSDIPGSPRPGSSSLHPRR